MSKKIKFLQVMGTLGCAMALSVSPIVALENSFFVDPNVQPVANTSTILGITTNDLDTKIKDLNKKWETIQKDTETLNQIANLRCELIAHIAQNQDFVDRYTTYTHSAKFLTSFETTEVLVFDVDSKGNYTEVESEKISLSQVAKFITIEKHADKFAELIKALKEFCLLVLCLLTFYCKNYDKVLTRFSKKDIIREKDYFMKRPSFLFYNFKDDI